MPKSYDAFRKQVEKKLTMNLMQYNEFHALIVEHAKVHCKSIPICEECPLIEICNQRLV